MDTTELQIKGAAFAIHADMKFGISPASDRGAIKWLNLALLWAIRRNKRELARIIRQYLLEWGEADPPGKRAGRRPCPNQFK